MAGWHTLTQRLPLIRSRRRRAANTTSATAGMKLATAPRGSDLAAPMAQSSRQSNEVLEVSPSQAVLPQRLGVRFAARVNLLTAFVPIVIFFFSAYQRRWMHDDGFINLRIVRNVLDGYGPVFNIGERVEATTSPLWVFLLVGAGALGARLEDAAVYAGLALATAGLACAMLAARARLTKSEGAALHATWLAPVGAMGFVVLPPAWDFATSGLETGLALFWLGASFLAVSSLTALGRAPVAGDDDGGGAARLRRTVAAGSAKWLLTAMLLGLGWLIRPELALYGAAMFAPLAYAFDAKNAARSSGYGVRVRRALLLVSAAVALPGGYQLFRMGYYGALTANPAIAKEAFRANWPQGWCYFQNFFGLYRWGVPAAVFALFYVLERRRRRALQPTARAMRAFDGTIPLLVAAAAVHVLYIVAIGGDYMHGRMFLPAIFAAMLPLALVPVRAAGGGRNERVARLVAVAILALWATVCAVGMRAGRENQCNIGDERAWYTREAQAANPIGVDDFRHHPFYLSGAYLRRGVEANCPSAMESKRRPGLGCRRMIELEATDEDKLSIDHPFKAVTKPVGADLAGVVATGAIGIVGALLPSAVHIVDRHGLADPVGARFALNERHRPGHEKRLNDAWVLARFTTPLFPEDAELTAARRALGCGRLAALLERTNDPLTSSLFLQNVAQASRMQRMRIPSDPFDAEERFCGTPPPVPLIAGGAGGWPFAWRCPAGTQLAGLRGSINDEAHAIAHVAPMCRPPIAPSAEVEGNDFALEGPPRGGVATEHVFDLRCPPWLLPKGLFGRASWVVHQIGLLCVDPHADGRGEASRTSAVGIEEGAPFQLVCPERTMPIGVTGRVGSLLDASGVLCSTPP
jgi:arabinofuranosyltransferase